MSTGRKKIYIASYPRSGNTWVRLLLEYAMGFPTRSIYTEEENARSGLKSTIVHPIRSVTEDDHHLVRSAPVEIIKTHEIEISDHHPVIYVLRDGRDATSSYWHYLKEFEGHEPGPFSDFLRNLKSGGNWWADHVFSWLVSDKNHQKLIVRFEDLLADQAGQLKLVLEFLSLTPVRKLEEFKSEVGFSRLREKLPTFFRSGKTGVWKEVFSPSDEDFFYQHDRGLLRRFGYIVAARGVRNASGPSSGSGARRRQLDASGKLIEAKGVGTPIKCWCGGAFAESQVPNYVCCKSCKTFELSPLPGSKELEQHYRTEYWRAMPAAFGHPTVQERSTLDFSNRIPLWFEILKIFAPPPARVLEIGAAHGGFLAYAYDRGYEEVIGIEPDPEVARFGREKFWLKHLIAGSFPETRLPYKQYDVIVSFDVLEHLLDPVAALNAIRELLPQDGVLMFQTPCYRDEGPDWDQFAPEHRHIHLFNRSSAELLLQKTGFTVDAVVPGYYPFDVIFIASRDDAAPDPARLLQQASALQKVLMRIVDQRERDYYGLLKDRTGWMRRYEELQAEHTKILEEARKREVQLIEKERELFTTLKVAEERERSLKANDEAASATLLAAEERLRLVQDMEVEIGTLRMTVAEKLKELDLIRSSSTEVIPTAEERGSSLIDKEREIEAIQRVAQERARELLEKEEEIVSTHKAAGERAHALLEKEAEIASTQKAAQERAQALLEKESEISLTQKAVEERANALLEKEAELGLTRKVAEERALALREKETEIASTQKVAGDRSRSLLEKEQEIAATKQSAEERAAALLEKEQVIASTKKIADERSFALIEKEKEIAATKKTAEERAVALMEKEREIANTKKSAEERAAALIEKEQEIARTRATAEERERALIEKERLIEAISASAKEGQVQLEQKQAALDQIRLEAEERAKLLLEKEKLIGTLFELSEERFRTIHHINQELETIKKHWLYRVGAKIKKMFGRT